MDEASWCIYLTKSNANVLYYSCIAKPCFDFTPDYYIHTDWDDFIGEAQNYWMKHTVFFGRRFANSTNTFPFSRSAGRWRAASGLSERLDETADDWFQHWELRWVLPKITLEYCTCLCFQMGIIYSYFLKRLRCPLIAYVYKSTFQDIYTF